MSGPPDHRHQIEFPDAVALFFRDRERTDEVVFVKPRARGAIWPRPLTYRGTDYGQWTEIWRLGLPTPRMGGPDYPGRVIRLERLSEGGNTTYRLYVADAGSAEAIQWQRSSGNNIGVTAGPLGREFGYW
jgi:hypothetical protein